MRGNQYLVYYTIIGYYNTNLLLNFEIVITQTCYLLLTIISKVNILLLFGTIRSVQCDY